MTTQETTRTALIISREDAQSRISEQIDNAEVLLRTPIKNADELADIRNSFYRWRDYNEELLKQIFSTHQVVNQFIPQAFAVGMPRQNLTLAERTGLLHDDINGYLERMKSIYERLNVYPVDVPVSERITVSEPLVFVERILRRFHLVARQLRNRHNNRETLVIADEYDLQDLLHALLRVYFNDIRPEEVTPSYAGGHTRMDFLLKAERIVVECKMMRDKLNGRLLGTQLIEDNACYQTHPDCQTLVCFVYDPDGRIANPTGIENDLSNSTNGINVKVLIVPKGE